MPFTETKLREVRLANTSGIHNKFYEMSVTKLEFDAAPIHQPTEFILMRRWGRIGTAGRVDTEKFNANSEAQEVLDKVKRVKMGKGYTIEWDRSGHPVPNAPTGNVKAVQQKLKDERAAQKGGELPSGFINDRSADAEAKKFNEVTAQRKEESEW